MTKLPNDDQLLAHYRRNLTDKQIAAMYGCTVQAVNLRLNRLGIERKPHSNTATALLEQAWPTAVYRRSRFTHFSRARRLWVFIRRNLGDPALSARQLHESLAFEHHIREHYVVLDLDLTQSNPWVFRPRLHLDEDLVIRWPEDRPKPSLRELEALRLPAAPWE
ncbi:hypothetical protein ACG5V6_05600 [Streptomyces chitinivorans]|uniref:Uncharacterized protein n=1 Tax=Streptomyces chitinivorans TaxID=1257027 RepID=A0ABW7HPB0_9ACTN|nr:hypothetical protein [Streptomyces chitinivorans]MDH2410306.1 hypothetical protein [Streptomyces chitinivorans]